MPIIFLSILRFHITMFCPSFIGSNAFGFGNSIYIQHLFVLAEELSILPDALYILKCVV